MNEKKMLHEVRDELLQLVEKISDFLNKEESEDVTTESNPPDPPPNPPGTGN